VTGAPGGVIPEVGIRGADVRQVGGQPFAVGARSRAQAQKQGLYAVMSRVGLRESHFRVRFHDVGVHPFEAQVVNGRMLQAGDSPRQHIVDAPGAHQAGRSVAKSPGPVAELDDRHALVMFDDRWRVEDRSQAARAAAHYDDRVRLRERLEGPGERRLRVDVAVVEGVYQGRIAHVGDFTAAQVRVARAVRDVDHIIIAERVFRVRQVKDARCAVGGAVLVFVGSGVEGHGAAGAAVPTRAAVLKVDQQPVRAALAGEKAVGRAVRAQRISARLDRLPFVVGLSRHPAAGNQRRHQPGCHRQQHPPVGHISPPFTDLVCE